MKRGKVGSLLNMRTINQNNFYKNKNIMKEIKKRKKTENQTCVQVYCWEPTIRSLPLAYELNEELKKFKLKLKDCSWLCYELPSVKKLFEIVAINHEYDSTKRNIRLRKYLRNLINQLDKICSSCKLIKRKMEICEGCRTAYYCSVECQKKDWREHKKYCKAHVHWRCSTKF